MHDTSWAPARHSRFPEKGSLQRPCHKALTSNPAFWLARPHCGGRWSPHAVPRLASVAHHVAITAAITAAIAPPQAVLEHARASAAEHSPTASSSPRQQHSSAPAGQEHVHRDHSDALAQHQRVVTRSPTSSVTNGAHELQTREPAPIPPAQRQLPSDVTPTLSQGQPGSSHEVGVLQEGVMTHQEGATEADKERMEWALEDTLTLLQGIADHGKAWAVIRRKCLPHLALKQVGGKGRPLLSQLAGMSVEEMKLVVRQRHQQHQQHREQEQQLQHQVQHQLQQLQEHPPLQQGPAQERAAVSPAQKGKQTYRGHPRYTKEDTLALLQGIAQYGKAWAVIQRKCLPHISVQSVGCKGRYLLRRLAGRSIEEMLREVQQPPQPQQQQQQQQQQHAQDGVAAPKEAAYWTKEDTLALLHGIAQHGTEWSVIQRERLPHLAPKRVWNKGNYLVRRSSVEDIRAALRLHFSEVPGSGSVGEQYVLGVLAAEEAQPASKRSKWTAEEQEALLQGLDAYGWDCDAIAAQLPGREPHQVLNRMFGMCKGPAGQALRAQVEGWKQKAAQRQHAATSAASAVDAPAAEEGATVKEASEEGPGAKAPKESPQWPKEDTLALLNGIAQYGTDWAAIQRECLPQLTAKRVAAKGRYLVKISSVEEIRAAVRRSGAESASDAGEHYVLRVLAAEERRGVDPWTAKEQEALLQGLDAYGWDFQAIAAQLPSRQPHQVLNRMYAMGRGASGRALRPQIHGWKSKALQRKLQTAASQVPSLEARSGGASSTAQAGAGQGATGRQVPAAAGPLQERGLGDAGLQGRAGELDAAEQVQSAAGMQQLVQLYEVKAQEAAVDSAASAAASVAAPSLAPLHGARQEAGQAVEHAASASAGGAPQEQVASRQACREDASASATATATQQSQGGEAAASIKRGKGVTGLCTWTEEERAAALEGFALYGPRYTTIARELLPGKDGAQVRGYVVAQQHEAIQAAFRSPEYAPLVRQRVQQDLEAARNALASQDSERGEGGSPPGALVWTARWSLQQHCTFLQGAAAYGLLNAAAIRLYHLPALSSEVVTTHACNYARHLAPLLLPPGLIPFSTPPASTAPAPTPTPRPPRNRRTPKPPPGSLTPLPIPAKVQQLEELLTRLSTNAQHLYHALSPPPSLPPLPPDLLSEIEAEMRHARTVFDTASTLLRTPPFLPYASTIPSLLPGVNTQHHKNAEDQLTALQPHQRPPSPPPAAAAAAGQQQQQLPSASTTAAWRTPATAAAKALAAAARAAPSLDPLAPPPNPLATPLDPLPPPPNPLPPPLGPQQPAPGLQPRSIPSRGRARRPASAMAKAAAAARRSAATRAAREHRV